MADDAVTDELPARLAELVDEMGDSPLSLETTISRANEAGEWAQVGRFRGRIPDPHEIGETFGSGRYLMAVRWQKNVSQPGRPNVRRLVFVLGSSYDEAAAAKRRDARRNDSETGTTEKALEIAERLVKLQRAPASDSGAAVAGIMERVLDRLDRMEERNAERFERMLERIQTTPKRDTLEDLQRLREAGEMLGIQIGPKADDEAPAWVAALGAIADNIGPYLEKLTAARVSVVKRVQLAADPNVRKIAAHAKQVSHDPAKRAAMIATMDEKIGAETVDSILEGLGVKR